VLHLLSERPIRHVLDCIEQLGAPAQEQTAVVSRKDHAIVAWLAVRLDNGRKVEPGSLGHGIDERLNLVLHLLLLAPDQFLATTLLRLLG
jgi:hypothetical protein